MYFVGIAVVPLLFICEKRNLNVVRTIILGISLWSLRGSVQFFKVDIIWQSKLFLQSLSNYFSNQSWIVFLGMTGNMVLVAQVGLLHQIIYSIAGFSSIPGSSRFAEMARSISSGNVAQFYQLRRRLLIQGTWALILFTSAGCLAYYYFLPLFTEAVNKISSISFSLPYFVTGIMVTAVLYLTIFENSRGKDRFIAISLAKILTTIFSFLVMLVTSSFWSISLLYFLSWIVIFMIALVLSKKFEESYES
jgi:hypothetical protein